jgi:hypothetical protein
VLMMKIDQSLSDQATGVQAGSAGSYALDNGDTFSGVKAAGA